MWVKICGTTSLADAQLALSAGADALGFVFAPSKRQVTATQVAAIIEGLPPGTETVGVFQSGDSVEIVAAARGARLSAVQVHSRFDGNLIRALRGELGEAIKLIQVISLPADGLDEGNFKEELAATLQERELWGILLDASVKGSSGGTGQSFDWGRAAAILGRAWPGQQDLSAGPRLVVAGGLRPENVAQAITVLRPFGVDVVSGVEQQAGLKDERRVRNFIAAAHAASNQNIA